MIMMIWLLFVSPDRQSDDASPRRLHRLARRSTLTVQPNSLRSLTTATFAERLTPHSTDMSHNSWSKPVTAGSLSHHRSLQEQHSSRRGPEQLWAASLSSPLRFWSLSSGRNRRTGSGLWSFSSLMNRASNAGGDRRGDSLIISTTVPRWQIFIEFWAEISLYFLPWITETLAPMAPVYEGKMLLTNGLFFLLLLWCGAPSLSL